MNLLFSFLLTISILLGVDSAINNNGLYYIINEYSGKPLDCGPNPVAITSSITSSAQVFQLIPLTYSWYQVKCMNNDKCWDYRGVDSKIGRESCSSTNNDQKYKFILRSGYENRYEIQAAAYSRYVDVDGLTDGSTLNTDPSRNSAAEQHHFILIELDDCALERLEYEDCLKS
eukprot:137335_1